MTAPTGNVWNDPDTGKPANPTNVQQDMGTGIPVNRKYGPGVRGTGAGSEVDPVAHRMNRAIDDAEAEVVGRLEGRSAVVEGNIIDRKYGPGTSAMKADGPANARAAQDLAITKVSVRDLGHEAQDKKVSPEQRAKAQQGLEQLARNEYARADGGRREIVASLTRFGLGPEKFRPAPVSVPEQEG